MSGSSWPYSVEKLRFERQPKILAALQPAAISRHEGTPDRRARLRPSSCGGLDACHGRMKGRTLTPPRNRIGVEFEFFNMA